MRSFIFQKYIIGSLFLLFIGMNSVKGALVGISLIPSTIQENSPIGTTVGALITYDDGGDEYYGTYSLVNNILYPDNSYFYIDGYNLVANGSFNYEVKSSYTIRVHSVVGIESFDATCIVSIEDVNEAPVLSGVSATILSYTENAAPLQITSTITVTDVDDTNLDSARVAITDGYVNGEDTLTFTPANGITGTWKPVHGKLLLSGSATLINYRTALRSVKYANTSDDPSTVDRKISFNVHDGNLISDTVKRNLTVSAMNDAPVLSGIETTTLAYTENGAPLNITNTILVNDDDDTNLESATVAITTGYQNGQDTLLYTNANGITGTWIPASGTLSLTGTSTVANYRSALRSVRYANNSENPSTTARVISSTVNDGNVNSNTVTRNLSVTRVNDAPVLSAIETTALTYIENSPSIQITSTTLVADDDDTNLESATVAITTGYQNGEDVLTFTNASGITGTWSAASGTMSLAGSSTKANYQSALRAVGYANTSENPSTVARVISLTVNDGNVNSNIVTRNLSVSNEQDAPVLSAIETTTRAYNENGVPLQITNTILVVDDDDTNLESATVAITTGYQNVEDTLTFTNANGITGTWIPASGTLSLTGTSTKANYQAALRAVRYANTSDDPSTSARVISFTVNDGDINSNTVTRNLSVTAVNDAPILSDIETTTLTYIENSPSVQITSVIKVVDEDDTNIESATIAITTGYHNGEDTLTFTNANGIIGTWSAATGTMSLAGTSLVANYQSALRAVRYANTSETPSTVARVISFTVRDGNVNSNTVTRNLTVTAQNDPPVASEAVIDGTHTPFHTRELLTADYIYTDPESNPESGTTMAWLVSNSSSGSSPSVARNYAAQDTFTTRFADGGKYISMVVLPRDNQGLTGDDDTSAWYYINAAPELQDLTIVNRLHPGAMAVGEKVSAEYDYYDKESNPAGIHQFQWYRSNTGSWTSPTPLSGQTDSTYTIQSADNTNYIAIEAYAYATSGSSPGQRTHSAWFLVGTLPTAVISGSDTICSAGQSAELTVTLTGESPWSFKYTVDGINETTVTGVTQPVYTLPVTQVGTYVLTEVGDDVFNHGTVSGTGRVSLYTKPTAVFTAGTTTCEQLNNNLRITLTGNSPWSVSYRYESGTPVSVTNILTSPHTIPVDNIGTYTLVSVNDEKCPGTATGTLEIIPAPEVTISGLEDQYSIDEVFVPFDVEPMGGNFSESDNRNAIIAIGEIWNFSPPIAYQTTGSPFMIIYSYQDISTGCIGKDSLLILIRSQDAEIQVYNDKEMFCSNDDTIVVYGLNLRDSIGSFSISSPGTGLINAGENVAYLLPGVIQSGSRTVTYTVDVGGDIKSAQKVFNFNHINVDFSWDNECFDEQSLVNFTDESIGTPNEVTGYQWNIYVNNDTITSYASQASYTFNNQQTYPVELIATSQYDTSYCYNTIRKDLILKPTFTVNGTPFIEDFQDNESSWYDFPELKVGRNTWTFGRPEGPVFNTDASEKAWYTNIDNLNLAENSYVISPCFDFTGARRPMIKMNVWRGFTTNNLELDGAVLQYTIDNGINWSQVGSVNDGIDWFNSFEIDGFPGGQRVGWTEIKDDSWMEVRHKLDELVNKKNVRFRIAYGAIVQPGVTCNGIAFDDFWIGERSKKVLIEHFTNASDELCKTVDEDFNAILNSNQNLYDDIIDLQFHMDYPGQDTFNVLSPDPPYSRDIYYGIPSIPYSIIDGGRGNKPAYMIDYRDQEEILVQNDLTLAVLVDNKFSINWQTNYIGNGFDIDLELVANVAFPQKDLTVHTVIIENQVSGITGDNGETNFESVVKAMKPTTGGTSFNRAWTVGAKEEINNLHYDLENVFDETQLRVVVFIQDNETGEVYQADKFNPNDTIVGIEAPEVTDRGFRIFPNPACDIAFIQLNEVAVGNVRFEIISLSGNLIYSKDVIAGEQLMEFPIGIYKPGIYMVRVIGNEKLLGTDKLIIVSNN